MCQKDNECKAVVLFIPFYSRKKVMKNFFKFEDVNNKLVEIDPSEIFIKADIGSRSLIYTWGSMNLGKLGLGPIKMNDTKISEFV